jgi:20S proteasome alpha/beta subunit
METTFALTGKGYVIMAADTTAARSIVKMKIDEDMIKAIRLMAYLGEPGKFNLIMPGFLFKQTD